VIAVRDATALDLDAIAAIEAICFPAAPWPRETFADELLRPLARMLVATQPTEGARIVGFSCTWHVAGEAHLLRIAIAPSLQRAGIGRGLLGRVIADARAAACAQVDLEVARSNAAAVAFYRAAGFVEIGERKQYYRAPPDDALLLRLSLTHAAVDDGAGLV
jgi:[ribosomal protein S18]-alanine N-acetyltransferase